MIAASSGAHLTRLALIRFRNHPQLAIEADARPVAIHGPNGAGKTNILEAVSMLAPGRGLRGAKVDEIAGRPDPIGWSVRAEAATPEGPRALSVAVDLRDGAKRQVRIDDAAASQTALGDILRILWLTPAMDRLWTDAASERRRFVDRAALAFEPSHGERAALYERAMRERNRLLKEGGAAPAWLDALEAQMADAAVAVVRARLAVLERWGRAQGDGTGAFPRADVALEDAPETIAAGPPGDAAAWAAAWARGRFRDAAAGRTLVGPHRADLAAVYAAKGVPAKFCSTGEQKALLISLTLATARSLAAETAAPPLLLLDEVAAHLDADRRAALFDEICALGAQAWATGTGPELFEAFGDRARLLAL